MPQTSPAPTPTSAATGQLAPIRRQSIYEAVVEQIKRYIVENRLVPGDRLPTEAAFAEQFGVSRLTVREAIKVLESLGVVQSRTRDGMRLRAMTFKPVADHLRFLLNVGEVTAPEIAVARQVLESSILPLVVRNATDEDLAELDAAVTAFAQEIQSGQDAIQEIIEADMRFHLILLRATRNRALEGFGVMLQEFFLHVRGEMLVRPERMQRSLKEHQELAAALRRRDATAAQEILREHLRVYDGLAGIGGGETDGGTKAREGGCGDA